MRWLFYYWLVGVVWQVYNLYGIPDISERVRETLAREMRAMSAVMFSFRVLGMALGCLVWPLLVIMTFAPRLLPKSWTQKVFDLFRRTYLDREGMLTPQMPAHRWMCTTHHEEEVGVHDVPCSVCAKPIAVVYCEKCVLAQSPTPMLVCTACSRAGRGRSNVLIMERMESGTLRLQDHARPCPWCGRNTIWSEKDATDQNIGMQHVEPTCEDWQRMRASPDANAFMLAAAEQAKTKVVALHCDDCSSAVMATVRVKGLTAEEERTFVSVHAGHKVTAVMFDGRLLPVAVPEPIADESRP